MSDSEESETERAQVVEDTSTHLIDDIYGEDLGKNKIKTFQYYYLRVTSSRNSSLNTSLTIHRLRVS